MEATTTIMHFETFQAVSFVVFAAMGFYFIISVIRLFRT